MAQIGDTLAWLLVKDTSSFIVRRNGRSDRVGNIEFNSEKGNVMNLNRAKYSGSNKKAVDLSHDGEKIVLGVKAQKKSKNPKKAFAATVLKKNFRASAGVINKAVLDNYYRADLRKETLARYNKLYNFGRVKRGTVKAPKMNKGRKSSA